LFGDEFVSPLQIPDISGYNSNQSKGVLCGFLHFLNYSKPFKFSFDHNSQRLKFTFSYIAYCLVNEEKKLCPWTGDEEDIGVTTPNFPMKGHWVRVFWENLGSWHLATVKRWSSNEKKWVLKYDEWSDTIYENVPVVKWKFE